MRSPLRQITYEGHDHGGGMFRYFIALCIALWLVTSIPFAAWLLFSFAPHIVPTTTICTMADRDACPDLFFTTVTWKWEQAPWVLLVNFRDIDPDWEVDHRELPGARWIAVADVVADPPWLGTCESASDGRIECDPVEQITD